MLDLLPYASGKFFDKPNSGGEIELLRGASKRLKQFFFWENKLVEHAEREGEIHAEPSGEWGRICVRNSFTYRYGKSSQNSK